MTTRHQQPCDSPAVSVTVYEFYEQVPDASAEAWCDKILFI